jgi:hypothetical protein
MEDILKAAGVRPMDDDPHPTDDNPRRTKKSKGARRGVTPREHDEDSYGGHNLRTVIHAREGDAVVFRPRSKLASAAAGQTLASVLETMDNTKPVKRGAGHDGDSNDEEEDSYDDEFGDVSEDDGVDDTGDDGEDGEDAKPTAASTPTTSKGKTLATCAAVPLRAATPPPRTNPFPLTIVHEDSALGQAASDIFTTVGYSLESDLRWQTAVGGDAAKIKAFRQDVTQQVELVAFAFMRPSSPFIQVVHSIATYAVRGAASELHGRDFGFVGDRTNLRTPTAIVVEDTMWKWMAKQMGMDVPPIQGFYANPLNAKRLYYDSASGGTDANVPRMLYLPPPFLAYCLETQRTPFSMHEFAAQLATCAGSDITVDMCTLIMDWCLVATQTAKASAPTTSMLAISPTMAPTDDDAFIRWLYRVDRTKVSEGNTQVQTLIQPSLPQGPAAQAAPGPPPADVWKQMAKSISTSFASAAAAMKPPATDEGDTSYELGGRLYDKFQMATVKGFAHVYDLADVPAIWALFQYTKHLETHKDNLRRKMMAWATSSQRSEQVTIDRSFFLPDTTMKEILSLQFNPGGIVPEAEEADSGLSLLICRARTTAAKSAIRKYEKAKEQSKRNRSLAEAEQELAAPAYDLGALPDDYNELLRCIGTYCALLFVLFGGKCSFYKHCYALWTTMNSDLVYEQRQTFFTVLFCRQIVWAVLAESRVFFSRRLSVDDFTGVHPDDVEYPRSQLLSIIANVRDGTPIIRGSFPAAWYPPGHVQGSANVSAAGERAARGTSAPVPSVSTVPAGTTPTVVSGLTTGSTRAPRPPIEIRANNIHPKIKQTMEPYILKHRAVYLTAMLNHANLTLDDLPRPTVAGAGSVCYNFILGRCAAEQCQHEHVNANDVSDELATDLLAKLRPSITEFMTNGLPPGTKRRRPRGRRRRE